MHNNRSINKNASQFFIGCDSRFESVHVGSLAIVQAVTAAVWAVTASMRACMNIFKNASNNLFLIGAKKT